MNDQFGLLYAHPTFLEGLARAIDLGDTLSEYNTAMNGQEADAKALRSDWRAVGDDLRTAIAEYRATVQAKDANLIND